MLVVISRVDALLLAQWKERHAWAESRGMGRWAEIEPQLQRAVAWAIAELRPMAVAERLRLGREAAESIPPNGDQLLFGAEPELIADLARVLAVLAYQPGGVFAFGRRWVAEP